jgi:methylated-DNA-protein-cysteine methyltransferase-like protein
MYEKIYEIVKQIPYGHVASYGQISILVCGCTPRLVGYALSSCPEENNIPWHRVINAQGKISLRRNGSNEITQQELLESEGIKFDINNIVSFSIYGCLPL